MKWLLRLLTVFLSFHAAVLISGFSHPADAAYFGKVSSLTTGQGQCDSPGPYVPPAVVKAIMSISFVDYCKIHMSKEVGKTAEGKSIFRFDCYDYHGKALDFKCTGNELSIEVPHPAFAD
jgi:hypothetical protein